MTMRWHVRKRAICAVALVVVLIGIALGVGLGVGLAKKGSGSQAACTSSGSGASIELSMSPPMNSSRPVGKAYISLAFEFSSFAAFAGNASTPNIYSNNLLNNLGNLTGTKPYVRVGGTSADEAIYDSSLPNATTHKQDTGLPTGQQPQQLEYGNVFFQSFNTWPDAKYIYDFNLGSIVGDTGNVGYTSLNATVPLICQALVNDKVLYWELGNEPNLYSNPSHGYVRAAVWTNERYIQQWQTGTEIIKAQLEANPECIALAQSGYGFAAPSLWTPTTDSEMTLPNLWNEGLDDTGIIRMISMHRYMLSTNQSDITLANSLLNHTLVAQSLSTVLKPYNSLGGNVPPLMLGETNSISNVGIPNITDTFAGALWAMNWALRGASQNISRLHFQQGVGFHYNSWDPIDSTNTSAGTRAPYYGQIAAAAAMGDSTQARVRVFAHELGSDTDAAYSVFSDDQLSRLAVLNLRQYLAGDATRGSWTYNFVVPESSNFHSVTVKRLLGTASNAITGTQWDGTQYDIAPNAGLANPTGNVTTGETFLVCNNSVGITLEDSSAAVIEFSS